MGGIDGSYPCPHHPEDGCDCRKPAPGMLHRAAWELDLDLKRSWLVGDALTDLQAAATAGGAGILCAQARSRSGIVVDARRAMASRGQFTGSCPIYL